MAIFLKKNVRPVHSMLSGAFLLILTLSKTHGDLWLTQDFDLTQLFGGWTPLPKCRGWARKDNSCKRRFCHLHWITVPIFATGASNVHFDFSVLYTTYEYTIYTLGGWVEQCADATVYWPMYFLQLCRIWTVTPQKWAWQNPADKGLALNLKEQSDKIKYLIALFVCLPKVQIPREWRTLRSYIFVKMKQFR